MPKPVGTIREILTRTPLAPVGRFARWLELEPRADLVTIGSVYGGKTVPVGPIDSDWICYSAGVGDDVSFDLGLIERFGCRVFALDPTPAATRYVEGLEIDDPRFLFVPIGLWSEDRTIDFYAPRQGDSNYSAVNLQGTHETISAPVKSLSTLMSEFGHERINLLKLDIEGAEYEVLRTMIDGDLHPDVLLVEFHKNDGLSLIKETVSALRARGYAVVARSGYDLTFVDRSLA